MASKNLLLINLGSPSAPEPRAVGRYLREFLMDRHVIDLPWPLRYPLVHAFIVPRRCHTSAEAYRKIWTKEGSPLLVHSRRFADGVARNLAGRWNVKLAMRYGAPSIASVMDEFPDGPIYVVPLYPQYAESSTKTAMEDVRRVSSRPCFFLQDFFDRPEFIQAQARRIQEALDQFQPDHLLLSFHGLPEHHMRKLHPEHCFQSLDCCAGVTSANRFCYRAQTQATARALRSALAFDPRKITVSYQSRLGRRPWIKPYTDLVAPELAAVGVKRLLVSCPSFVADCLETLEEIQIRLRDQFRACGGEELELVPALNDDPLWIENFSRMIETENTFAI